MSFRLDAAEEDIARGGKGEAPALALRMVAEMARLLGAPSLIPVQSAHIDGALYHGDSGVLFAEHLRGKGATVCVPTTLNIGALDLVHPHRVLLDPHRREMAGRMMKAYEAMGCRPTWTCAPYQAGHRPTKGTDVAWGESNAVVFCNSVLGARTNRYGDFLDICCALIGRAPYSGLHVPANRRATTVVDTTQISDALKALDVFYPVLGTWLGAELGGEVGVITGLPASTHEDQLKALGAAAASSGAVGLFHVVGITPEASTVAEACDFEVPQRIIALSPDMLRAARDRLTTATGDQVDAIALGSPHFSVAEFVGLERELSGRKATVPIFACTGRHVIKELEATGMVERLTALGITVIADTCIVATPILPARSGVLMTNSGKFAHYGPAQTGYQTIFGSLADCVASAMTGKLVRDETMWQ